MHDRPHPLPRVQGARGLLHRCRLALAAEVPTLAFVLAAVGLLALFRGLLFAGLTDEVTPLHEQLAQLQGDFVGHVAVALPMLAMVQPVRRLGPAGGALRVLTLAATVLLAAALVVTLRVIWMVGDVRAPEFAGYWGGLFPRVALLAGCLLAVGEFHRSEVRSLDAMRAEEAARAALEQQTLQARLKTLEAQIEPHFLFNTLATVRRLHETDLAAGEAMLTRLMHYLQAALPTMRDTAPTLEREARLIENYLELQKVRMGRRLDYRIDIAPGLRALQVPPMMLLTLVENAIKHGLSPLREGGRIDVGATLQGRQLSIAVTDTGRGFGADTAGGGTGLANIRARLEAMFGPAACLELVPRQPRGLVATIRLPLTQG